MPEKPALHHQHRAGLEQPQSHRMRPFRRTPSCLPRPRAQVPGTESIWIRTYGCAHNTSDSEYMAGQLQAYGYTLVRTRSGETRSALPVACACRLGAPTMQLSIGITAGRRLRRRGPVAHQHVHREESEPVRYGLGYPQGQRPRKETRRCRCVWRDYALGPAPQSAPHHLSARSALHLRLPSRRVRPAGGQARRCPRGSQCHRRDETHTPPTPPCASPAITICPAFLPATTRPRCRGGGCPAQIRLSYTSPAAGLELCRTCLLSPRAAPRRPLPAPQARPRLTAWSRPWRRRLRVTQCTCSQRRHCRGWTCQRRGARWWRQLVVSRPLAPGLW